MTLKHVHFAKHDISYSPEPSIIETPPLTPSSTLSSNSSLPEPPLIPLSRLKPSKVLKPKPNNDIQIHHLLTISSNPPLSYDLSLPLAYPPPPLYDSVSLPALCSLTIICPKLLPWPIPVTTSFNFITIADVLTAIHRTLRLAVHPLEYAALSESSQIVVANAYEERCRAASVAMGNAHDTSEAKKGVKRVDFLGGRNRFIGLSRALGGPHLGTSEVWELVVS